MTGSSQYGCPGIGALDSAAGLWGWFCPDSDSMFLSWVISKSGKKTTFVLHVANFAAGHRTHQACAVNVCVLRGDTCIINIASIEWWIIMPVQRNQFIWTPPIQSSRGLFKNMLMSREECVLLYLLRTVLNVSMNVHVKYLLYSLISFILILSVNTHLSVSQILKVWSQSLAVQIISAVILSKFPNAAIIRPFSQRIQVVGSMSSLRCYTKTGRLLYWFHLEVAPRKSTHILQLSRWRFCRYLSAASLLATAAVVTSSLPGWRTLNSCKRPSPERTADVKG